MVGIRCILSDRLYDDKCQIYIRATITRTYRPMLKTDIYVNPKFFRNGTIVENVVGRVSDKHRQEVREAKQKLHLYCAYLEALVHKFPQKVLKKDWLKMEMQRCRYTLDTITDDEREVDLQDVQDAIASGKSEKRLYDYIDQYVSSKNLSKKRIMKYHVIKRRLIRYELFEHYMGDDSFRLTPDSLDADILNRFQTFCLNQEELAKSYPIIFKAIEKGVEEKAPYENKDHVQQVSNISQNTCIEMLVDVKALVNWLVTKSVILEDPFSQVVIKQKHFTARPIFITIEERKKLATLTLNRTLTVQRDIFIFHCLVGCRYGDLVKLTDDNLVDGSFLQYVPEKTKKAVNHITPKVPLTEEAKALVMKYKGKDKKGRLFPFTSNTYYNERLKEIFTIAGLTRTVQVMNPHTRQPESVPLNEYVSSHLARRTFIGNLYNKIKDPGIISAMSGHAEHSRAFSRYRDIGDDVRRELIEKIE